MIAHRLIRQGDVMKDKVIALTGASEGIGRAIALRIAAQGGTLVLAARNQAKLDAVAAECEALGGTALAIPTDVGDEAACKNLIDTTVETYGRLDVLINNAGISMHGRVDELKDTALFERIMRVNYMGTVWPTYYALPHLKASKGMVVGVSSLQGKLGFPGSSAYAASKHAVQGFFDSLRIELMGSGVGVLVASPGAVDTGIHGKRQTGDGTMADEGRDFSDKKQMSAERCAELIVGGIQKRRRDLIMTAGGKMAVWLKPFFPGYVDNRVKAAVEDWYAD